MAGIFKAYDVRGVYGDVLNKDMGYKIGLAYSNLIGAGKTICCGKDARVSSDELQEAFIEGCLDGGTHVVNIGLCTTPTTYFACFSGNYDGSTMITASHNPGKYNGLKFCRENAIPVGYDDGIHIIEEAIEAGSSTKVDVRGTLSEKSYQDAYLAFLKERSTFTRKFKFAVDPGNGMGGYLIKDYLDLVGQEAEELFWEIDCSFPNHEANPLNFNNLVDLQNAVKKGNLEFGVAFDGDADRCFFVDDQGEVVPADILTTLIATDVLKKTGPGTIVYDIRSSKVVAEQVHALGGKAILCRVGHSFMKSCLRQHGGPFGGELAGHFYFRDFCFADSAFLTMAVVMNIIDESGQSLSQLIAPFKKYVPSGEINFKIDHADAMLEQAQERFPGGEVLTIDGIRIDFADWWFSLRKSNTEPLLRLVVEGDTEKIMSSRVKEITHWLEENGAQLDDH